MAAAAAYLADIRIQFEKLKVQPRHGMFGPMRRSEWGIWAWRHLDHHLRQFGA